MTRTHPPGHIWHPQYGAWSEADRLEAVRLVLAGARTADVGPLFHVAQVTVRRWVREAREHNPEE